MVVNRAQRVAAVIAGGVALAFGLSSCVLLEGPSPEVPERTVRVTPSVPSEDSGNSESPVPPEGSAEAKFADFTAALKSFAGGTEAVRGQPIVNSLVSAGFDKSAMQVSFDTSRTNLVADSIFVSVRIDESCLLGQITTESRELVTDLAPAVGPDQNICLIGQTRPIDW
ncbi:DUF6993 domain-containing protein [Leucobacter denitrificans]|uniref:DUF6993 domain-containing protein n=1 Tax=Leucobacter denitrificans TaxID=683042 RepID=A0A7G9S633_9MICO|nr:hypothetical protein [Leucobacter denitrificans]QNN63308.1 hypothetical protein H9L06_02930 [Leucobacter denitrificans]